MPVHKIPAASLHEDLIALEREGETVVTATNVGTYVVVTTRYHGQDEKRPLRDLTHAARVGAMETRAKWDDPLLESFISDDIVRGGA